ncbi:MAG TPA: outer membrane protein assembly factor BamA, partial [Desulfuromonadales bacterium]|nr:outer membrane protein assembly factor BamA [Desulfuromonadales bacterium]
MIKKLLAFLFFLLLPVAALAQSYTIGAVNIEGNHRVDTSVIRGVILVKTGQAATPSDIDKDVRAIYALKHFKDVWASVDNKSGAAILTYHVVERPLVRAIKFVGNKELKEKKLKPLLTQKVPGIFDPQALSKSVKAIRTAYKDKGYYAVSVEPKVDVDAKNDATITIHIKEGKKALINRIRFSGNKVFTAKQLRKVMQTKVRWFLSWLTNRGTYKEDILQNDLGLIADKYYNNGYIRVKVKQPKVTLSKDKENLTILIPIVEGQQYRVGTIAVGGDLIKPKKDLIDMIQLHTGDVFDRKKLRDSVLAINDLYADKGYAYVNVIPLTHVDQDKRIVNLKVDVEQGIQVHIHQIHITGNTKTRDKIIRRQMKLVEGHLYSATGLKQSKAKIRNLGFFDSVDVNSAKGPDDADMNVDVKVKEQPTGTFSVGAGYSSVDGIVGQASVQQNNFLGRALKLNLATSAGAKTNTIQAGILNPYFLDTDIALGGDLYKTRHEYTDYTKRAIGGDVKFGFPMTENVHFFSIYRFEKDNIGNVLPGSIYYDQVGESTLSSISASITRNTT